MFRRDFRPDRALAVLQSANCRWAPGARSRLRNRRNSSRINLLRPSPDDASRTLCRGLLTVEKKLRDPCVFGPSSPRVSGTAIKVFHRRINANPRTNRGRPFRNGRFGKEPSTKHRTFRATFRPAPGESPRPSSRDRRGRGTHRGRARCPRRSRPSRDTRAGASRPRT